ncbi:MAG TPA: DUF4382 domain-containing protein [Gemmatimonadaceae bacterium]|nr:DUF4382 domain-containing protein [Gemmatimonadaceae bacterium]
MRQTKWIVAAAAAFAVGALACADEPTAQRSSRLIVRLTDAPLTDSVEKVEMHIVRIEARVAAADSAAADSAVDESAAKRGGWVTIAKPDRLIDILTLRDDTTTVGESFMPSGDYRGIRLVLDPAKSSVTLKGGQVLTGSSSPGIRFPSAAHSGIKVHIAEPDSAVAVADSTTTLVVDFDLENSFVVRGNSISKNGLTFKPVIRAEVTAKP